jgi:alpha-mannosidase
MANEPPSLALVKNHATRPEEASFIAVAPANVSLTGMKQSEEGDELIIRLIETEGKETTATIELPFAAQTARRLNILELPLTDEPQPAMNGKTVTVKLKPNEIVTLGIK